MNRVVCMIMGFVLIPGFSSAWNEAKGWEQLMEAGKGTEVCVQLNGSADKSCGILGDVWRTGMSIITDGRAVMQFRREEVKEVRKRAERNLRPAVLIGLGAGGTAGFLVGRTIEKDKTGEDKGIATFYTTGAGCGLGAVTGAILGLLLHLEKHELIYRKDHKESRP